MLAPEQRLTRIGLALVIGGAAGNLIDRVTLGYVLDFVDVYCGGWHFWAFNVADAAITIGVALMILDLLGAGRLPCIQNCLASARSPSTPTACCWRPRTCSACGWRCRAPRSAGLDCQPRARPRHLHHHRRAGRREAAAARRRLRSVPPVARGSAVARPLRRRVLRRADPRGGRGVLVHRQTPHAVLDDVRRVRARASRWDTSPAGSAASRPAAATASRPTCRGRSSSPTRWPPPTSARRSASRCIPTQLYEAGAELLILVLLLATERRGRPFAGRTFWAYMLLYAISRYIIEIYRGDPRGVRARHVLDVAVHLAGPRAAQPRHAVRGCRRSTPETPQEMRGRRRAAA